MEQLAGKDDAYRPSCAENQNLVTGHDVAILDILKCAAVLGVRWSVQDDGHINVYFKYETITPPLVGPISSSDAANNDQLSRIVCAG